MIEINFPLRDDHDCACVPAMSLPRVRGILQLLGEAIAAKGAGTVPQALSTLHVACAGSLSSWTAVPAVAPEDVFDQTGNQAQFWNYGDESPIGWASNFAETIHVSVLLVL